MSGSRSLTHFFDCAFLYAMAGLGQALVLVSLYHGNLTEVAALSYWLGFALIAGITVVPLGRRLETHHAIALFMIVLGGPLGAVFSIILCRIFLDGAKKAPADLLAWYETLAGRGEEFAPELKDWGSEAETTVLDPDAPTLAEIVRNGTLSEKRNAIAQMAAAYHRDYHPLLKAALNDTEPTIRVQAAAVLTGLGQEERERLAALIEEIPSTSDSGLLDLSDRLARQITSRLLDAEGIRLAVRTLVPIAADVIERGSTQDHARLRMQLVWCAHHVGGKEGTVLRSLLQKLLSHPELEQAS